MIVLTAVLDTVVLDTVVLELPVNMSFHPLNPASACNSAATGMQPTDLQAVIDRSLRSLRPQLKSGSNAEIQVIRNYGNLSAVECSAQIHQVFTSLIAQAIAALSTDSASPQITIRTMQIPDPQGGNPRAVVCIADNGAELPLAMQAEIFSAAATGPRASSNLSICYEVVVNQHGGDLQCYSQAGSTEFWVELPVKQELKTALQSASSLPPNLPIHLPSHLSNHRQAALQLAFT